MEPPVEEALQDRHGIEMVDEPSQKTRRRKMAQAANWERGVRGVGRAARQWVGASLLLAIFATGAEGVWAQLQLSRPKAEAALENPYPIGVPREKILEVVRSVLQECKIELQEERTRPTEGKLTTKPVVFSRGGTTRNNLEYFAAMPASDVRSWTQGRYFLEITALPLDQNRSQIFVAAHIEGRYADASTGAQWAEGQSNGRLEDEVLRGLAGKILGIDLSRKSATTERRLLTCIY